MERFFWGYAFPLVGHVAKKSVVRTIFLLLQGQRLSMHHGTVLAGFRNAIIFCYFGRLLWKLLTSGSGGSEWSCSHSYFANRRVIGTGKPGGRYL
jgi:hypothetical protein